MANQHNIYDTPSASLENRGRPGAIPIGIIEQLSATGGWVRFIAVLFFIGAGLTVIFGLVFGLAGVFTGMEGLRGMDSFATSLGAGVMNILIAALYFFLGLYLFKYAFAIKRSVASNHSDDVELAITYQRRFWRLSGIMALIGLSVFAVAIVLTVVLGFVAAGVAP